MNSTEIKALVIPKLVIANGAAYLTQYKELDNGGLELTNCFALGAPQQISDKDVAEYIGAAFADKLTNSKIGANSSWFATDLDDDLSLAWETSKLKIQRAIITAPVNLVLEAFKSS